MVHVYRMPSQVEINCGVSGDSVENNEIARTSSIQVISRAANILRLLGKETDGLSLGQIASHVELPRSTVQRIVSALADEGFISNTKRNGSICLGPEIQQLAKASGKSIKDRLRPVMKSLSDETGETVDLAILEDGRMRFIDQIEGSQRLRTVSSIGEAFPLTNTANGKAALASLDRAQAVSLIKSELGLSRETGKALKNLLSELDLIDAGELATDENEHTDGICALGVAGIDENGVVYAISIPVPATRYIREKSRLSRIVKRLTKDLAGFR